VSVTDLVRPLAARGDPGSSRTAGGARALAAFAACWLFGAVGLGIAVLTVLRYSYGLDAHTYWTAWAGGSLYMGRPLLYGPDQFLYAPAFGQLIWPLTRLPWEAFLALWVSLAMAAYAWLLWPLRLRYRVPLLLAALMPALNGNIEWLIAVALVVGLEWPASWVIPLLTKVTPGVGLLWFAGRREWRRLVLAVAATLLVVAVSAALDPAAWLRWIQVLVDNATTHGGVVLFPFGHAMPPLWARLPVAAALAWYAGRTDRIWLVPIAMVAAMPDIGIAITWGVFTSLPRLMRWQAAAAAPRS
jgi:hypothetical protein